MDKNSERSQITATFPDKSGQSLMPGGRKRSRQYLAIAVVVVIAIIVIAFLAVPPMKGLIAQMYLHDGDYIEYNVTGTALLIPFSGTLRIDISNVSQDGFTATLTTTGVPGGGTETLRYGWDDRILGDIDIGTKVGTAQISTPWGQKTVDRYFLSNDTGDITTYLGDDPEMVYRIEVVGSLYSMTVLMTDTDIDIIRNGNK